MVGLVMLAAALIWVWCACATASIAQAKSYPYWEVWLYSLVVLPIMIPAVILLPPAQSARLDDLVATTRHRVRGRWFQSPMDKTRLTVCLAGLSALILLPGPSIGGSVTQLEQMSRHAIALEACVIASDRLTHCLPWPSPDAGAVTRSDQSPQPDWPGSRLAEQVPPAKGGTGQRGTDTEVPAPESEPSGAVEQRRIVDPFGLLKPWGNEARPSRPADRPAPDTRDRPQADREVGQRPRRGDHSRVQVLEPAQPLEVLRALQIQLKHLGFEPGPIDGLYGPKTARAIGRFLKREGSNQAVGMDRHTATELLRVAMGVPSEPEPAMIVEAVSTTKAFSGGLFSDPNSIGPVQDEALPDPLDSEPMNLLGTAPWNVPETVNSGVAHSTLSGSKQ